MDELSEEDKLIVARARKISASCRSRSTWPRCSPASPGMFVELEDTIRSFKAIVRRRIRPPAGAGLLHGRHHRRSRRQGPEDGGGSGMNGRQDRLRPGLARAASALRRSRMVTVPGTEGYMGVMAGHMPLVSTLRPGMIDVHGRRRAALFHPRRLCRSQRQQDHGAGRGSRSDGGNGCAALDQRIKNAEEELSQAKNDAERAKAPGYSETISRTSRAGRFNFHVNIRV